MDSPRTAVVLVGQNPTPALLSSLTFPIEHLALVASDETRPAATRVAEAVERLTAIASVRVLSVGPDPHDHQRTAGVLAGLHRELGEEPWFLDYTGGTKMMSVAAALVHEQLFAPDRHPWSRRWRHYLDATSDTLRTSDSAHPGRPVASDLVDLSTLAEIHGARWIEDRDPEPVRLFAQGGKQALLARFPDLPHAERRGIFAEGRVLSHLRRHTRNRPDTEVLGARQVADPFRPTGSIADFDVLVRHRHRVLCVEVKTRPDDVVGRAGWTVAKARRVFGNLAGVLFVYSGPAVSGLRDRITAYNPALTGRNIHVWNLDDFLKRLTSFDHLREAFFPGLDGAEPPLAEAPHPEPPAIPDSSADVPAPAARHPGPEDSPLLVTSLGSSRLGTLAAVHAHLPARTLVLSSRQSVRDRVRESAARTLHAVENPGAAPADDAHLKEAGYRYRVRFTPDPVESSDADAVAAVASAWITREQGTEHPVVADFTTGTKAMSLGLAQAARRTGACATYQLARRRTVICLTHGPRPLRGRAAVDWPLVLSGYVPLDGALVPRLCRAARVQVDAGLLEAARTALTGAASGPVGVWLDSSLTDPDTCVTAQERPSLILTFDDRAVGLAAPAWRRRRARDSRVHEVSPGTWAQSVFAATTHLYGLSDVAGTVIALTRTGGDVSRAVELVDWIGHTEPGQQHRPRIAFGDPLSPVVVSGSPGALPGLFDTDVSRL